MDLQVDSLGNGQIQLCVHASVQCVSVCEYVHTRECWTQLTNSPTPSFFLAPQVLAGMPLRWFGLTVLEVQHEVVHTHANDAIRALMATPQLEGAFRRWAAAPTTRRSAKPAAAAAAMPAQVTPTPYQISIQ